MLGVFWKTPFRLLSIVTVTSTLLCSCDTTPRVFGMPESQFYQLSPSQQRQVIDSYNRKQEIQEYNRPAEELINVLDTAIRTQQSKP